jgi:hypothetical protein
LDFRPAGVCLEPAGGVAGLAVGAGSAGGPLALKIVAKFFIVSDTLLLSCLAMTGESPSR